MYACKACAAIACLKTAGCISYGMGIVSLDPHYTMHGEHAAAFYYQGTKHYSFLGEGIVSENEGETGGRAGVCWCGRYLQANTEVQETRNHH